MLASGRLTSLSNLDPNQQLSVEPNRWNRERQQLRVRDAISQMEAEGKATDRVFLTRGKPISDAAYGRYIIEKELRTPRESDIINMVPEEYTNRRPISLKRKASVYVPDTEHAELSKINKLVNLKNMSDYKGEYLDSSSITALIRKLQLNAGLGKVAAHSITAKNVKRKFGTTAELVGSRGLGTDLKENADTDVLMTFDNENKMNKAIGRIKKKYTLKASKYNKPSKTRHVYQGKDLDVTFSHSDDVKKHLDSYLKAKSKLTSKQKHQIRKDKKKVLGSWVFKDKRYKDYKKNLDKKLGIIRL